MAVKSEIATLDFASLLAPENPQPARLTILQPNEAYDPNVKVEKNNSKIENGDISKKQKNDRDLQASQFVMKLVSNTKTYTSVVGGDDYYNRGRGINKNSFNDDIIAMVRSMPKVHHSEEEFSPLLHGLSQSNWEKKILWEGTKTEKINKKITNGSAVDSASKKGKELLSATALLNEPRNPELDALVLDETNINWEGTSTALTGSRTKIKPVPLILELGVAGQSIARQVIPVSRPVPFDQTEAFMRRHYKKEGNMASSTAEISKGSLTENKQEKAKLIEQRQKKRAQMAKDKTTRVTDAMDTIQMGGGTGRTITSSLMGPGGTERTGRPARGGPGNTAHHDAEYVEQLSMVYNHVFSKPELSVVDLRQHHRPKLPLQFARRTWQFQMRYVPTPKKADSAANSSYSYTAHAGSTSQVKIRTEADLNPTEGKLVLMEYSEERPPIQLTKGMASKIVNYFRGDKSRCPVSVGGGDKPTRRKRAENADDSGKGTSSFSGKIERPPRLKGMGTETTLEDWIGKIPKRKRDEGQSGNGSTKPSHVVLPEGISEILHPKVHGPFFGEVEDGIIQTGLINNLFTAPLFRHEAESSDFLMILGKRAIFAGNKNDGRKQYNHNSTGEKMSVVLRPLPDNIFTVGQVEPRVDGLVHPPQTTGERNFLQNFVSYHIAKQLNYYERHEGRGLRFDEITNMWAGSGIQNNSLRQRIKTVASYDKNTQIWEAKPISDYDYQGIDALARRIPPEGVATYETACAAMRRLADIGIMDLYKGSGAPVQGVRIVSDYLARQKNAAQELRRKIQKKLERIPKGSGNALQIALYEKAFEKLEETFKELKRKHDVAEFIYQELCLAPWHLTFEFIDVHKQHHGTGQLELQGKADPSGGQGGYSFLRDTEKAKGNKAGAATAEGYQKSLIKKITGTDNDLRKLTMKQMGNILKSFGMPIQKIDTLKRWDRVHVIRDYSTKAASDGIGEEFSKFARGEKLKLSEQKEDYQKRIQEIWRRQRKSLMSDAGDFRQGGGHGDGEDGFDNDNNAPSENKAGAVESDNDSSDGDSDDDLFAEDMFEQLENEKQGTQLLASQRREGDMTTLGRDNTSQDLENEARDLVALRKKKEEANDTQAGINDIGMAPKNRSMAGKKVIRRRITKTFPTGKQVTTFKFIFDDEEIEALRLKKIEEEKSGINTKRKKQVHKQNDRAYGHAMFEDDDNYELASTDIYRNVRNTGRGAGTRKLMKSNPKARRAIGTAGRAKAKASASDRRIKKRKKEQEEADLYVPPSKRKTTAANRRDRGAGRSRLPHVILSNKLEKMRADVERFPSSGPFRRPVDKRKFPHYYEKISDPIDLQTIRDKNQICKYKTADAFLRDFELMKNNAEKFNGVSNPLALEANRIYDQVKQMIETNREELTQMELNLQAKDNPKGNSSGLKGAKKRKGASAAKQEQTATSESGMIDGMAVGDLSKFSDDSDSDDSGTELIEVG